MFPNVNYTLMPFKKLNDIKRISVKVKKRTFVFKIKKQSCVKESGNYSYI